MFLMPISEPVSVKLKQSLKRATTVDFSTISAIKHIACYQMG